MPSEKLQVILELITGNYKREAAAAATATGQIGKVAQTTSTGLSNFGKGLSNFGTGLTRSVTLPLAAMAAGAIKAASDLGESVNAIGKVFGDSVGPIAEFGEISAVAVGLSERAFNNLATVTGSLLKNLGYDLDTAADSTIILAERAADMASVFNTDVPTAMEAINSALKGEGNPIEQFGVRVSAAAVAAKAVALGLAESTTSVSDYAKAQATLALIMEQTTDLQGDFAETSDGVANSTRILKAKVEDAAAALGEALLPIVEKLLDKALDLVDAFNGLSDEQKELVLQTAGLVAIGGPALILIGKLVTAYAALKTALLGAAGAGGVAAGAGWWKILGLGAAAGLAHREVVEIGLSMELDEEGLAELHEILGKLEVEVHDSWQNVAAQGREVHDSWQTAGTGFKEAADAVKDDLIPGLNDLAAASAPAIRGLLEAKLAAIEAAAALQDDLAEGYAAAAFSIDKAATNIGVSLSRMETNLEQNLADQLAFYTNLDTLADAGLTDLAAFLENEGSEKAAGATATLVGDMERAWNFERMIDQGRNDMERATTELATSLQDGAAAVVDVAYQIGIDLIDQLRAGFSTKDLSDLLGIALGAPGLGPVQTGSSGTTTTTNVTRKALGGPVSAFRPYLVGERGPEMFVSGTSGNIIPNDVLKSMSRPNTTIVVQSPMDNFRQDLQYATVVASLQNLVEAF